MITDKEIVAGVREIGNKVWQLENKVATLQRIVDLLLINDPECEVKKHFVERAKTKREYQEASDKAQEKIREIRGEIERLLSQHPELREANER
jgi:predicted nuclease with TOPRIM domain